MSTTKQIAANRRNALKSTGPRTPAGKARSSLNALTHGLTAQQVVLDSEDAAGFAELRRALEDEHQPATSTEELLLHQLAVAAWRLRRARSMESATLNYRFEDNEESFDEDDPTPTNEFRQAYAFFTGRGGQQALMRLSQYELRVERAFYRALRELRQLQKDRRAADSNPPDPSRPAPAAVHEMDLPGAATVRERIKKSAPLTVSKPNNPNPIREIGFVFPKPGSGPLPPGA